MLPDIIKKSIEADFEALGAPDPASMAIDVEAQHERDAGLPRWDLGHCPCCGLALELEAFGNSLLLVETDLGDENGMPCPIGESCDAVNAKDCPASSDGMLGGGIEDEIAHQVDVIARVIARKMLEFGWCSITKDVLARAAIIKALENVNLHEIPPSTGRDSARYAVFIDDVPPGSVEWPFLEHVGTGKTPDP